MKLLMADWSAGATRGDGPCPWTLAARLLALGVATTMLAAPSLPPWFLLLRPGPESAYLLLAAVGVLTGFLSGLLGIGGALVAVPALHLLLPILGIGADQVSQVAVASSLAAMVPMALMAAWTQHRRGGLDTAWLKRLAPGVALGAAAGALAAMQLQGPLLALLFAAQSLCYGWALVRAPQREPASRSAVGHLAQTACRWPSWAVGPLAAGFSACAGMGASSLLVPYLNAQGLALRVASATSGALNLGIAASGVLLFAMSSTLASTVGPCWPAALLLSACAVLAVPAGVALAHRLPLSTFRRLLGAINLLGALVLLARTASV